jgi:plastocyanin
MNRRNLVALLGAATLALAACSGSGATTAPATPGLTAAPPSTAVSGAPSAAPASSAPSAATACAVVTGATGTAAQIQGFAFPSGLTVKAGQAITWTNGDGAPHTVTFDDGSCASGQIGPGSSVTVRYDVAGTFTFHCSIHTSMKGTLVVTG